MNKIITIFLLILIVLGFLNNIIEYFRSKTSAVRNFEHNSFRHFNHLFIPIVFIIGAVWIFLKISHEFHIAINLLLAALALLFITMALIPFYLYSNYLMNQRVDHLLYNAEKGLVEIEGQPIKKNQVSQVNWYKVRNKSMIIIWSNFEYVEIIMKDGTRYVVTSLLMNLKLFQKYFQNNVVSYYSSLVPRIKS